MGVLACQLFGSRGGQAGLAAEDGYPTVFAAANSLAPARRDGHGLKPVAHRLKPIPRRRAGRRGTG